MDAEQKNNWVAVLQALTTAVGMADLPGAQMRAWVQRTLGSIPSAALSGSDADDIIDTFLARMQTTNRSVQPLTGFPTDQGRRKAPAPSVQLAPPTTPRLLEQTANPYPLVGTYDSPPSAALSNPYASPTSYLLHPTIDVLDQETIAKIASRDTGA